MSEDFKSGGRKRPGSRGPGGGGFKGGPRKGGKPGGFKKPDGGKFAGRPKPDKSRRGGRPEGRSGGEPVQFSAADGEKGERIAKVMARAGLCSRRDAETWIEAGRVQLNGKVLETPAITVTAKDTVLVDGEPLPLRERTRLWLYHKPRGLVTTNKDPEGRPTVFERLPKDLPRVLSVGRLDINTEGLLLLTNDGGLARVLELPATGWLRRYRVRAFGKVTQAELDTLADGVAIDGVLYGAIEATLDKEQGDNIWLSVSLREGKNREVKRVLEHLGLAVNRLIRLSFGPFQLMDLEEGGVREIRGRVLRDQLGEKLAEEAGADFDAPLLHQPQSERSDKSGGSRKASTDKSGGKRGEWMTAREGAAASHGRKQRKDDRKSSRTGGGKPPRYNKGEQSSSWNERSDGEREGASRDATPHGSGRRNQGERQQKISPRSRFRMTKEPSKRPMRDERPERPLPQRRIWGDEGLVEDKQQERRMGRDQKRPERSDRPNRPDRSDRPDRNDRSRSERSRDGRRPREDRD